MLRTVRLAGPQHRALRTTSFPELSMLPGPLRSKVLWWLGQDRENTVSS